MDSYQGSMYDPVSLHKYLYANANPVMYADPSGYATDKNLTETVVATTIAVMLASSVALHNQAMLNIFSSLRKNMADAVMSLQCTVTVTDWKNVILGFPAHDFDTKWLITIPMALSSWQLFKAINDVKEADDEVETPGIPEEQDDEVSEQENNEQEEKDISEIIEDAKDTTNNAGVAKNYEKSGGYEQALKDFEKLKPKDVKDIQTKYGPGKVGTLKNGGKVVARPGSKTGGATLEIKISNKKVYKIRY